MDTKKELLKMCQRIADEIGTGNYDMGEWDTAIAIEWGGPCAAHYLNDALDIEYTIDANFEYVGARIAVALGGPNIYIDTRREIVQGYWGEDKVEVSYSHDQLGLDDYCCELYDTSR